MKNNFDKSILIRFNIDIRYMLSEFRELLSMRTDYFANNAYANKYFSEFEINVWESMKTHCKDFYEKLEALEKWGKNE